MVLLLVLCALIDDGVCQRDPFAEIDDVRQSMVTLHYGKKPSSLRPSNRVNAVVFQWLVKGL